MNWHTGGEKIGNAQAECLNHPVDAIDFDFLPTVTDLKKVLLKDSNSVIPKPVSSIQVIRNVVLGCVNCIVPEEEPYEEVAQGLKGLPISLGVPPECLLSQ